MSKMDEFSIQQTPLWEHMTNVLSHIIQERPANALDAVVPTSNYVLTGNAVPGKEHNTFSETRLAARSKVPTDAMKNTHWASNFGAAVAPPKPKRRPLDGEEEPMVDPEEEEEDVAMDKAIDDVVAEQAIFNEVGEGIPPEEAFRVVIGLKQLMKAEPLASVSFWGKISGSRSDYYVAEAKIDPNRLVEEPEMGDDEEDEDGQPVDAIADVLFSHAVKRNHAVERETEGTGVNENVYYVSLVVDPTRWTRLPDALPDQIAAARKIRSGFTGDLEAPVYSHPVFLGVEKHYLRAQIARISCACRVAPKDIFTTEGALPPEEEDDDGNIKPPPLTVAAYSAVPPLLPQPIPDEDDAEGIQLVKSWYHGYQDDELLQGKSWVHIAPTLLKAGRVTVGDEAPEAVDGGDGDGDEVDGTEQIHPFLCEVSRDTQLSYPGHSRGSFPAWSFRMAFHNESSASRIYVARSGLWLGSFTYALTTKGEPGAQYQTVYIGNGLKSACGVWYSPPLPRRRLVEFPEAGLVFQRDATVDEELQFAPLPTRKEDSDDEEGDEEP